MKIVQSFWSKPFLKKRPASIEDRKVGGFISKRFFYFSWALSCLQLKEFYTDVELVTDSKGKHLLIDLLNLPYSQVNLSLDQLETEHEDLWALGKLKAYEIQKNPFIHVDSDVFIWSKFPQSVESALLVAQNFEPGVVEETRDIVLSTYKNFNYFPYFMKKEPFYIKMYNAGILGGNLVSFFEQYVQEAYTFIKRNVKYLSSIGIGSFNVVFEQYLFYRLVESKNINVTVLFEDMDINFSKITEFNNVPHKSTYIHLLGKYKKSENISRQLEIRLLLDYPHYYFRILELLEKKIL